ncbi:hypothetical protein DFH06DRAFT_1094851 [Mycena polygramma]|nr:hypothetical protein DFH06DRAFT_1094851 [Mycena polygramma]
MPESREAEASYLIVNDGVTELIEAGASLTLESIEIDATDKEQARFKKDHPASRGLPYTIDSKSTVTRGTNKAQGYVYPPMWRTPGKQPAKDLLSQLVLKDISYTHRSLILDFGKLFLMIQWMTHTSAQLYPRIDWETTVKLTDKKVRKFCVGMALVFKDHVLSFQSADLVFQPTWTESRDALPPCPADFYSADWDFLRDLAQWMRNRLSADTDQNGLACEVIRAANTVFLGIGVYTVIEIFFLAGLSPLLTEAEVFSNPSRTARFCAGYLQFLHQSRMGLRSLIRPAMHSGYLAPTTAQRLKYIDWLHVYAKDCARIPVRMAALVDDYIGKLEEFSSHSSWVRYDTPSLYDVFEPTLVSAALSLDHNLGHLIYGSDVWIQLGGTLSEGKDPLTSFFRERDHIEAPTFLRPGHYDPLFLEAGDIRAQSLPRRTTFTFRSNKKQLWSITPFPDNSQGRAQVEDSTCVQQIIGEDRKRMLFSHIVKKTRKVAIGPLEYCGNARRVKIGSSTVVTPCYGDPSLPEFYAVRNLKSRFLPPVVPGARRQGISSSEQTIFEDSLSTLISLKRSRFDEKENEADVSISRPKPKRRRLSADKQLALQSIN